VDIFKRLRIIINEQDISISRFEKEIGVGNNTISTILRKESGISHIILEKIKNRYPQYSICWLVAGEQNNSNYKLIQQIKFEINALLDKKNGTQSGS
jgi:transcriptional regulator with XRE-family HTH domain|tara:strand:+ start:553 stop:843 length:291 start_codon:yes stop_codon:yes gene_type:complete